MEEWTYSLQVTLPLIGVEGVRSPQICLEISLCRDRPIPAKGIQRVTNRVKFEVATLPYSCCRASSSGAGSSGACRGWRSNGGGGGGGGGVTVRHARQQKTATATEGCCLHPTANGECPTLCQFYDSYVAICRQTGWWVEGWVCRNTGHGKK